VVVPGACAECVQDRAKMFSDGLAHLATHGYRTDASMVGGRSSSRHNAAQIRDAVAGMALASAERLVLVGHSKGAADILEALVAHPEIVPHVAAVVSVAGAINGSLLSDGLRDLFADVLRKIPLRECSAGDGGVLESLHRAERLRFLATAVLPNAVRYFSLVAIAGRDETSALLRPMHRRLAEIDPRNDGQVLWTDAVIPGAVLLGYVRADHWAIAMPFSRTSPALAATLIDRNAFPREVLLEAIVRTVEESL
jgi:pimeloyl-ACP methyl ester carboxylesterase